MYGVGLKNDIKPEYKLKIWVVLASYIQRVLNTLD
jgi:hypothetical protein